MSTFRWLERYTSFCVSVVEESDAERVLAAFGGVPDEAVRGGPRDAQAFAAEEFGFYPVLRIVERDGWSVVVELFSAEGLRRPVAQRLARLGRVMSFGLGEGGYRLIHTDGTAVPDPMPLHDGSDLGELARHAGVSGDGWAEEDPGRAAVEFVRRVTGVVLDDVVLKSPGLAGRALPVLPEVEVLPLPARSETDARIAAALAGSEDAAVLPIVAEHVAAFLAEVGIAEGDVVGAVSQRGDGRPVELGDESALGVALRELLAEAWLITGSGPAAAGGTRHDVEALRQRVAAGWAAAGLLQAGPAAALGQMMHRRRGAGWRERLAADLERVSAAGSGALAEGRAEVEARRARSARVPANLLRPAPRRFVRPADEGQL